MEKDRQTAIHEAGHAVIGRALGLACGNVSIESTTANSVRYCEIDGPRFAWRRGDGSKRAVADAFCITLYAGTEAERLFLGSAAIRDALDCDRASQCMAWAGVRGAAHYRDEAYVRNEARLRAKARQEVFRNRNRIEALADALVLRRKMSSHEVDGLLR